MPSRSHSDRNHDDDAVALSAPLRGRTDATVEMRSGTDTSTRVLFIGRHYWPHVGYDSAGHLIQLTSGLARQGIHIEVATPRFATSWTEQFKFREIMVHRPTVAPRRDWTVNRYTRGLTQWLRQQVNDFDVLWVDCIREEAIAAIEASRGKRCSVILRLGNDGQARDDQWWKRNRASQRCAAIGRMADAVIVSSVDQERSLLTHQYSAAKIHRIDVGLPNRVDLGNAQRASSRRALAAVNGDLATNDDTIVLLCHCPMTRDSGIETLVSQMRHLVQKHPQLKVWMVGDGSDRNRIFSRLKSDGVRSFVAMPGSFSSLEELISAADLYVHPGETGLDFVLPSAIAGELPMLVADVPSLRRCVGDDGESEVTWFDPVSSRDLTRQTTSLISDLEGARQRAHSLKRRKLKVQSESSALDQHLALIRSLIPSRSSLTKSVAPSNAPRATS